MFSFNWLWLEIASETVKKSASLRAIAKFEFGLEVLKWQTDEIVKLLNLNWLGLEIGRETVKCLSVADFVVQIVPFLAFVRVQIVPFVVQIVPFLSFVRVQIVPFSTLAFC